jgi:hypothetical protein
MTGESIDVEARLMEADVHQHSLVTETYTERIRDGVRLPIMANNVYHFEDQAFRNVYSQNITIKTGDELVATCIFNSQDRASPTFVGGSAADEMCWSNLWWETRRAAPAQGDSPWDSFVCVESVLWMGSLNDTEPGLGLDLRHPVAEADRVFNLGHGWTGGMLTNGISSEVKEVAFQHITTRPCEDEQWTKYLCGSSFDGFVTKDSECDKTYKELGMEDGWIWYVGDTLPLQLC